MSIERVVYLDHNATTPCDPRVVEAMLPYFTDQFWNASSSHVLGRRAGRAVEEARERAARALGVGFEDLVFTSGSTEALQLAIERLPIEAVAAGIAVSPVEHRAVLNAVGRSRESGVPVRALPSLRGGTVDVNAIDRPAVYVVQAANSETGVLQPLRTIYERVRSVGGILISDATQALWKLPLAEFAGHADALVFSAHKAYGPKGVGLLVATGGFRRLLQGSAGEGAQEGRIREGTLNVPAIVGMGAALDLVATEGADWRQVANEGRDAFEERLLAAQEGEVSINFPDLPRLPNTSSVCFREIPGDLLASNLRSVVLSYGSACSSGSFEPSQALIASGVPREDARCTLRASFGRDQGSEISAAAVRLLAFTLSAVEKR